MGQAAVDEPLLAPPLPAVTGCLLPAFSDGADESDFFSVEVDAPSDAPFDEPEPLVEPEPFVDFASARLSVR